jgi:serine phosphatase RsbU (regulator of sigma subunit)/pSer/pThr/pTyr-binding forkhead associated (FHA) protein
MSTAEARLQVIDNSGRRLVPLDKPVFIIGRRTAADLQLLNADVSREHAEIARDGVRFLLRDRGSRYGTFVNGEQVTERPLAHGDRIRLGRTEGVELVFMSDGTSATHASGLRDAASEVGDLRQMAAILDGLRALGSGRVLDEVLTLVLDSALDVTKAERGFVMLARPDGELEFKVARGRNRITLSGTSFTTSTKIPREVFQTGESRLVGDLMDGNLAGMHDGTIAIGIRHVLCVPLSVSPMSAGADDGVSARVIGVLYLDSRERGTILSQATRSSLEAFATQAALAIESARLYAEAAEKARIDRDLRIAADIQRALLPDGNYEDGIVDLAAASVPCRTIGGDFFDYIDLAGRGFGFALGDVAGKGPPAALLAAAVLTNFGAHAPISSDPADTMTRINRALLRRAIEARFATMFHGAVLADGTLKYCNAGQEPPLVVRRDDVLWLEHGGPVLGLLSIATYECGEVSLAPGDLVVVCSDGVTEARNRQGAEFGRDRLVQAMAGTHGQKPDAALERLLEEVRRFSEGGAQGDDITVLVLRYRGAASPV